MADPKSRRRALLLRNTHARNGREGAWLAAQQLRKQGLEVVELALGDPFDAAAVASDVVVVVGGDGSMHRAVQSLVHLRVPLGVVPMGTANDLARSLGIPLDLEEACDVIVHGVEKRIDLGHVCDRYFLNAAGLGLSGEVTRRLTRDLKRRWGALSYGRAALEALQAVRPFRVTLRGAGGEYTFPSIQVVVGNGRHYGGGMTVDEEAEIDDQRLHIYSLDPVSWWRLAALIPALRSGRQAAHDRAHTWCSSHFEIATSRPTRIHADGEWVGRTPAVFKVVPNALRVIAPLPKAESTS